MTQIDAKLENFQGYRSVMSVAYKNQTRNTRFFGKGKQISSFRAEANVKKKDMKKLLAQYEEDLNSFAEVLKNREIEEDRLLEESAILNSFSSNGFGIFNIDKLENTKILAKVDASFDFEDVKQFLNNLFNLL